MAPVTRPVNSNSIPNPVPGQQAGSSQVGILVELRVISQLLNDAFELNYDLEALRQDILPYLS